MTKRGAEGLSVNLLQLGLRIIGCRAGQPSLSAGSSAVHWAADAVGCGVKKVVRDRLDGVLVGLQKAGEVPLRASRLNEALERAWPLLRKQQQDVAMRTLAVLGRRRDVVNRWVAA